MLNQSMLRHSIHAFAVTGLILTSTIACSSSKELIAPVRNESITRETHEVIGRPYEIETVVGESVTAEVSGGLIFGLIPTGIYAKNPFRRLAAWALYLPGDALTLIPGAGEQARAPLAATGAVIAGDPDLIEAAKAAAIVKAKAQGLYVTHLDYKTSGFWFFFRSSTAKITGRAITYKPIGPVSKARIDAIVKAVSEHKYRMAGSK